MKSVGVAEIRNKFRTKYALEKERYNKEDAKRVLLDDNYLLKFIDKKKITLQEAFEEIDETLKWRNNFGVAKISANDFPEEFLSLVNLSAYVKLVNRVPVVFVRLKLCKCEKWRKTYHKFIVYILELMEKRSPNRDTQWNLVLDLMHEELSNLESDLEYFGVETFLRYFPQKISYVVIYQIPWFLWLISKLTLALLPSHFADDMNITLLDSEQTRHFLDFSDSGKCELLQG
ncbi:Motile sperm domain-containing protein 2-like protein [Leptotrombidium deliense]|uniref:Motile sperm domain-containing protein 2-like protein n=1 Tax=Leptotrombidium deliense TaxID=299467 RepID=A0A443SK03_9ACAR|nr:Motile sperm domain-containing protein 2-like protein [Leptotrombidium deliense]